MLGCGRWVALDHKIIPTAAATKRLRNQLASHVGGGTMDFVWGPELQFKESSSQVYKFLGEAKYQPVLTSIYAGLGIPPTLTGASTSGGYSNNFRVFKDFDRKTGVRQGYYFWFLEAGT